MISRNIGLQVKKLLRFYPIVSLSGPRQSGKTTLLRYQYPTLPYASFEDPDVRRYSMSDPRGFLDQFPKGCIIDEVQLNPEILSYLQTRVDLNAKLKFLISGSQNFLLMEKVTQSLAGRAGLLTLLPFSRNEMPMPVLEEWIWKGGYPALYDRNIPPKTFFPNYIQTYLERDVRTLLNVGSLLDFERFLRLCAGRSGQLLNLSSLASDTGISVNTAKAWISVLEASYTIFLLPPYHNNFNKRMIKMPKLYFWDTGLLSWLLNIDLASRITSHFAVGSLFENAIIVEMAKQYFNRGETPSFYFLRDSNGNEVDLLIERGNSIKAVEIKFGKTINDDYFRGLNVWAKVSGQPLKNGYLIYGGEHESIYKGFHVMPWNSKNVLTGKF
ncbi:MAG: ATP-binding protein [Saprospiraceae bacterium]|uniref:ATP-binding protein n=1 Tax=Candidatus Opimibacter skivensis TaxID=2982028 RepID=A0A9D7SXI5_9BACT|nr:ATP-binding protein [Candidatus Opimibacter skivensis]